MYGGRPFAAAVLPLMVCAEGCVTAWVSVALGPAVVAKMVKPTTPSRPTETESTQRQHPERATLPR